MGDGNYLTESDLGRIKGLVHYMNEAFADNPELDAEITLSDSNGEQVGVVKLINDHYVFVVQA